MAGNNRPARLNRTLLALIGLVLLVAGAVVAALGLGLLRALLPGVDPSAPLLPAQLALPTWAAYVAIAAAVVVGLLCLRWLLAQAQRRPKARTWTLPGAGGRDAGTTRIDTDQAAAAVADDVAAYAGVSKARADLTGDPENPTLQLQVTASQEASATELRRRIHDHALPRLRQALDTESIQARLILALDSTPPGRTR
ncbi:alkaline shock response membrane anchor protein AmaP [Pseudonocardia sp. KRD291]|uniref:alkaline shock response membrane anchor protein AmaP n=1 Tax=Pseudonocardia sp. KRD291 TaxID=2792007 RepID=UPI001C4A190E|nr:alkaline shock response membrane anchor protein AmaP [Pseudonocardia sp. KRD291]MBW0102893.1 alkaline shock response membrane anchor protein AmaP [Pseudonocardia sp. KRD291]